MAEEERRKAISKPALMVVSEEEPHKEQNDAENDAESAQKQEEEA